MLHQGQVNEDVVELLSLQAGFVSPGSICGYASKCVCQRKAMQSTPLQQHIPSVVPGWHWIDTENVSIVIIISTANLCIEITCYDDTSAALSRFSALSLHLGVDSLHLAVLMATVRHVSTNHLNFKATTDLNAKGCTPLGDWLEDSMIPTVVQQKAYSASPLGASAQFNVSINSLYLCDT